jgi:hypothetical protein
MKHAQLKLVMMCVLCGIFAESAVFAQQRPPTPLTNAAVVRLVRAGFKEKTVIAIIRSRPSRFELDADRLIELKRSGVTENIILAMMSQDESLSFTDDNWSDDSFFKGNTNSGDNKSGGNRPGETDIFGSSGGSKDQTKGRGLSGSNQNEQTTSGSATVRILRPPTEAGGGSPKLEKTPTLNNDSIVRLVDAGFSEGTIIKRIEDSPADFDLSPTRLAELRKRRVTEAIISAMTAAMDESSPKTNGAGRSGER